MFISEPKISVNLNLQKKQSENLKSTNLSNNIRSTQTLQKIRLTKISSLNMNKPSQNTSPNKQNSVQSIYTELHSCIESIDQKINYLLEKQSNEYKVVYQHYYKKFKDELQQLKLKTIEQQKKYLQNDHVKFLQSQLKILRQQVVVYKNSYEKLKKQNDQLKKGLKFNQQDITFLENNVKNRIKEIKLLTAQNFRLEQLINQRSFNQTQQSKISASSHSKQVKKRSNSMNFETQPQIKIQFRKYQPNPVYKQFSSNRNIYEEFILADRSTKDIKTGSLRSLVEKPNQPNNNKNQYLQNFTTKKERKYFRSQISQKAEKNSKTQSICDWFLECVESVRKQIFHRKYQNTNCQLDRINNGYRFLNSLNDFKRLDKLQLMKIFLSNQELVSMIYHQLKNQKKFSLENSKIQNSRNIQKNKSQQNVDVEENTETDDLEARFSNFQLRKNTTKISTHKKTLTQIGFFDWKLVQKAGKFQNLSQFNTTTAIQRKSIHSQKSNNKSLDSKIDLKIQMNPKKTQEQKNIKMMKKITAIMNKKKNLPLSSQLFARKKNFFIE